MEAAKKAASAAGMKIKEVLWGQYDIAVIAESPDEVTGAAFGLNTLKLGNVRGQTMRAFTAADEKDFGEVAWPAKSAPTPLGDGSSV